MTTNYKRGIWAEWLAAVYLFIKGYQILKLRAKTPVGEIDILARKRDLLVAVEVKCSDKHATLERVDQMKQYRVTRALEWLRTQKTYTQFVDFRFDVIALSGLHVYHLRNAW